MFGRPSIVLLASHLDCPELDDEWREAAQLLVCQPGVVQVELPHLVAAGVKGQ